MQRFDQKDGSFSSVQAPTAATDFLAGRKGAGGADAAAPDPPGDARGETGWPLFPRLRASGVHPIARRTQPEFWGDWTMAAANSVGAGASRVAWLTWPDGHRRAETAAAALRLREHRAAPELPARVSPGAGPAEHPVAAAARAAARPSVRPHRPFTSPPSTILQVPFRFPSPWLLTGPPCRAKG